MSAYNSSASGIEALWDDFQDKQSLAFVDVDDWFTSMHYYFYRAGHDNDEADIAWAAMEDAIEHLEDVTGPDVQPSLELLLTLLDDAAAKLETVIAADALDSSAKAYFTSTNHFELPSQPFVFWTDTDQENIVGWVEFDFPVLAVGNNLQTSYTSSEIGDFISHIDEMWDWIEFGLWLQRHWDDGIEINYDAGQLFDDICSGCPGLTFAQYIINDCYTQETLEDWCEVHYAEECGAGLTDREKNQALSEHWRCHSAANIERVKEAVEDYLTSGWLEYLPWL